MNNNYTIENPMAPLWLMYPYMLKESSQWNEGKGKKYSNDFYKWFKNLKDEEQNSFKIMYPQPKLWANKNNTEKSLNFTIENLKSEYNKGIKKEYVFFWKSRGNLISNSCFSQWCKIDFKENNTTYCCMEQYMMSKKALLFNDLEINKKIMESKDPNQIKSYGRKVKNFDEQLWNKYKYLIVLTGNYMKFIQNKDLMLYLFNTKNKILVEASPYDTIWGIGMSAENKEINNPNFWKGENLLGFALTEVREELKAVCKNYNKINWNLLYSEYAV